jgi:hypothetical protein
VPSETPVNDQPAEVHVVPLAGADPFHDDCFAPLSVQTIAVVPLAAVTEKVSEPVVAEVMTGWVGLETVGL